MEREKLKELILECKMLGFSDVQLSNLLNKDEMEIRALKKELGINPLYKMVDTCAAEFEAKTPYFYSCYENIFYEGEQNESNPSNRKKIIILGSGPIRIGQGVEFD
ncbi:MAG TPA: carbamoyl-phosphate synthase large chain, partial [Methanothermococcus okinawensis]|nr:carbamoyl-phosphate synthase large chain [Methanothermococcus okinawensis]